VLKRPGEVISRMSINSLEKTESDPYVDGDDMKVWLEPAVEQRSENCAHAEDHDFERVGIFRSQTEWRRVFMVELVNMLVEQGRVEELMSKVVEHVLEEKEESELWEHCLPWREGHLPSTHSKSLGDGVKEEYRWSLNCKMGKQDTLGTLPLLLWCGHLSRLQFPLAEVWDCVNNDPGYAATKIDGLVKDEGGNASRNDRVTYPQVPCHPVPLKPVKLGIV